MYSTGCPSSSGSYSVMLPWSGGVCWVLLRPPPRSLLSHLRHQRSRFPLLNGTGGYFLFLLPVLPQARPVHSRSFAPVCGMGFHWHRDCSPLFFPTRSTLA